MSDLFETVAPGARIVGYAQVAIERGIDTTPRGLTYAVPEALETLQPGERVVVPLGKRDRRVPGYVIERIATCDLTASTVKAILARDAHNLSLGTDLLALARWMANYYCCPLGMVFAAMLPAAVKRGSGLVAQTLVQMRQEGDHPARDQPHKLTRLQHQVLEAARSAAAEGQRELDLRSLADRAGARSTVAVKNLIDKGLLVTHRRMQVCAGIDPAQPQSADSLIVPELNTCQAKAVQKVCERLGDGFSIHLLHGVTGSGKTEVYLRIIEHLLMHRGPHADSGAIVLVPEIALTPQTVHRFVNRFESVAVLHSGLTDVQRHEQWRRIANGQTRIVVGARSAVFAPLPQVGVMIVDEEHESSYKQEQLPRYHARDVAIKRAQLANVPVVLGSATPSLESFYNATHVDRYHYHHLPKRVANLQLPVVDIVDMGQERRKRFAQTGKGGVHLLSLRLETAISQTLAAGGQVILLLNRRGYANYIACPDHRCGWLMNCEYCDATMVYHKQRTLPSGGFVRCHHCSAELLLPKQCPQCHVHKVTIFGLGTQRVEEELFRKFPSVQLLRMDSDTMRHGRDYEQSLEMFRAGKVDILLGTQMIAKGLDFPNVRLVGVISADTALHLPDFRAAERTFQLVSQVAGRCGRGKELGRVIVQSFSPSDPAVLFSAAHDYKAFADREIGLRCQVGLPPATRMARVVVRYRDHCRCRQHAVHLARELMVRSTQLGLNILVRDAAPCPLARIAGYHRYQIEMITLPPPQEAAARLQKLMTAMRNAQLLHADEHTAVDVDPVQML